MRDAFLFLLVAVFCGNSYSSSDYLVSWNKLERFTHDNIIGFISNKNSSLQSILEQTNLSFNCRNLLIDYANGIKNLNLNDIKRLDSTGKWPAGLLSGTFTDLGSYDTCLSLESTQYCLLYTNVPLMPESGYEGFLRPYDSKLFNFSTEPFKFFQKNIHFLRRMNITTGLCIPKDCSNLELTAIISNIYQHFNTGLTANVDLCHSKPQKISWRISELIGLTVVCLIICLPIIASRVSESSVLYCFNWKANSVKLFAPRKSSEYIDFLDGIKVLTMIMVINAHFEATNMYNLFTSSFKFTNIASSVIAIPIYLSPYTVDLFLMITGLLIAYQFFSAKRTFPLIPYIIGRWLRFATLLAWIICLQFILFSDHSREYFGGPFWSDYNAIGSIVEACERTWPWTLLLSQFWFDSSNDVNVCLLFDWYLAADFILSLLFLLVLWPYLNGKRIWALINTYVLIIIGLIATGLGIYTLDISSTWIVTNFQRMPFMRYTFDFNLKPWPHIGPYFVGVLFGYILSNPKLKLSKLIFTLGWMLCVTCFSINFFYEYLVNRFGYDFDYPIALTYGTVSKTIWALGWAWIVLILKLGYIPIVSRLLSCSAFRILSRINLSVLCFQFVVIRLRAGSYQTLIYPSIIESIMFRYIPLYLIIYFCGAITALLVEYPTMNLLKLIFLSSKPRNKLPEVDNNASDTKDQKVIECQVISNKIAA